MHVVYTPAHLRHDPARRVRDLAGAQPVRAHRPGRGDPRDAAGRRLVPRSVEPTSGAPHRSRRCTIRVWCASCRAAWAEYQTAQPGHPRGGARRVLPQRPAQQDECADRARVDQRSPRAGGASRRPRRSPRAPTRQPAARSTRRSPPRSWCSTASGTPTACAGRPATTPTTSLYGGYCFFNNAAIAAHHVASTTGTKVTVLDVDYHHGNGTQEIFYDRDDVQYVSLHGDPARAYPYSIGYADETGTGAGLGANLNLPLAERTDDDRYVDGAGGARATRSSAFGPRTLIVSLGARHVRHRSDLRSRRHAPTASSAAVRWLPSWACPPWCCRRAATTSTASARTCAAGWWGCAATERPSGSVGRRLRPQRGSPRRTGRACWGRRP